MYGNKDEYREATKDASVNTYGHSKISNSKLIIVNLFLASTLGIMGYVGLGSFGEKISLVKQTKVLGATHTIDDENFINMLNNTEVDTLNSSENNIRHAIDSIVSSSVGEEDSYMKSISKEIVSTSKSKIVNTSNSDIVTIVVKQGDTLASLAEEYYGDSNAYDKIIKANRRLTQASHTIYVGDRINLPY